MTSTSNTSADAASASIHVEGDIYELTDRASVSASPYYSDDTAPVPASGRRWNTRDMAVLWIGLCACVPTYMLASGLIAAGMNWLQAVLTITAANVIVVIPMILNAHAGTRYGISFPVYCRASFGILGANVPALLRAFVACGWFGIQTWIGGSAIYKMMTVFYPAITTWPIISQAVPITRGQLGCFLAFWLINMFVIYMGIESIRVLLNIKAPLLIAMGLVLLDWAYRRANGFGPMLNEPSAFAAGGPKTGQFWAFFFPALTGMVGFWATLALNIPDFSRYAYSQRSQVVGQIIGLPPTMALYSFIGVAVTSATIAIYGKAIWDPTDLLTRFADKGVLVVAMACLCIATLATNIAANVVSPANDFSHVWPRFISFRAGGFLTGLIGIVMQPWKLLASYETYIITWLVGYSSLLGAIGGILLVDYFVIRRMQIDLAALYKRHGTYWYTGGFNPRAIIALVLGVLPCVPGFLQTVELADKMPGVWQMLFHTTTVPDVWVQVYHYAWFVSMAIAAFTYLLLTAVFRPSLGNVSAKLALA